MNTVLALRHVVFEDLDGIAPLLIGHGYTPCYVETGYDDPATLDPPVADLWLEQTGL